MEKRKRDTLRDRAADLMDRGPDDPPDRGPAEEMDGGGSVWDRVGRVSTIAPVMGDPGVEPADNPWEVAMMAGWGDVNDDGRGHDALQGAEELLLGEADATAFMTVDPTPNEDRAPMLTFQGDEAQLTAEESHRDWCTHL
jgi:hypothetical protein